MKQKENNTKYLQYIDDEGYQFEMAVIKHFTYEGKQYVLLTEHDDHEEENCCYHDETHHHEATKENEKDVLYAFELITGVEGEKLIPVKDEMLWELNPILEQLL